MLLAEEAVLLEIHPSYRLGSALGWPLAWREDLFATAIDSTGDLQGHLDAVPADAGEFREALDAAVRLAVFDDGVAECGLSCDARVLALDSGNASSARLLPPTPFRAGVLSSFDLLTSIVVTVPHYGRRRGKKSASVLLDASSIFVPSF